MRRWAAIGIAATMVAAAALGAAAGADAKADVKAGVDAWLRGDHPRAVAIWQPLAAAGDADAQFDLGQAYKLGRGVPADAAAARGWFLKAANQGNLPAADNYGLSLFESGQHGEAAPWLAKSAARGEPRAELAYGSMLFNGDGVGRDPVRAYEVVKRASLVSPTAQARDPKLRQLAAAAAATLTQMDPYVAAADRQRASDAAQRFVANRAAAPAIVRTAAARPLPAAPAAAPRAPAAGGGWRIQLGAFRDGANARARWAQIGAKTGGAPAYLAGGGVTRLQAGPFATRAAAQRACDAAGGGCVVVGP